MKPTLLLLAAGMGSRYGGLKQLMMLFRLVSERSYSLSARTSKISSVRRFFQSMRVIFLQNFASKHWMISQRDSLYQKVVRNHGVQTMQC